MRWLARAAALATVALASCLPTVLAASESAPTQWITFQTDDGQTLYLRDNRQPSLYTGNFGDCLGDSLINVTRFDAAYYQDNMTVLFHLAGNSALTNESLMMYIGVYAYGKNYFDLTFNPCAANIDSLCPLTSDVPIQANGIIPVSVSDVSGIPSIAFSIPDFEGEAILRIFANSTESEIGCFSAVITNGNSFSQPTSVGTVLGIFTAVSLLASFATAIYGEAVPTMRLHYAHSLSVGVVFAVFQHIFFTGALSVNWPSVLVAWWSNFAWAGGMIYSSQMQSSINRLIGHNVGNTSHVGAAASGTSQDSVGGGYDISEIYKRALHPSGPQWRSQPLMRDVASETYGRPGGVFLKRDLAQSALQRTIARRELANSSTGYHYYGQPVADGLPLPGNYSGFAGTLAQEGIATSNAFMTGFLWFLILLAGLVAALVVFKWVLEGLVSVKAVKHDRLKFFRDHWLGYSAALALRICYLGFFAIMFLTIFQFTYDSSGAVKAIAAIVFVLFLLGISGLAAYACLYKFRLDARDGGAPIQPKQRKTFLGKIPGFRMKASETAVDDEQGRERAGQGGKGHTKPFWRRVSSSGSFTNQETAPYSIHDNEQYITKFGWLAARFRRTRWWFFTVWVFYELVRAIFYGGASGYPLAQVFGLLVVEFLAFVYIVWARPFEGQRLNILVVYCLGFSKVASVALSAAFDTQFNLERITTTVIGIVVIVIQGILTIITMIAIVIGAISSYMSVSRSHDDFRPRKWAGLREKYFDHLDRTVSDLPREPKPKLPPPEPVETKEGFEMKSIRRLGKIEDEDAYASETHLHDPSASHLGLDASRAPTPAGPASTRNSEIGAAEIAGGRSRATSLQSMAHPNVPFNPRSHRRSWSMRDFDDGTEHAWTPIDMTQMVAEDEPVAEAPPAANRDGHAVRNSRSTTLPNAAIRPQVSNDELRVGGDVSTRDTIGKVPMPTVRPRAGTFGSTRSSRASSAALGGSSERLSDMFHMRPGSQRGTTHPTLAPAQEQDEFGLSPRVSRDQQ